MFKAKFRIFLHEASELLQGARNPSNFHPHRNSSDIVVSHYTEFIHTSIMKRIEDIQIQLQFYFT